MKCEQSTILRLYVNILLQAYKGNVENNITYYIYIK